MDNIKHTCKVDDKGLGICSCVPTVRTKNNMADTKEKLIHIFDKKVTENEVLRDTLGKWGREQVRGIMFQLLAQLQQETEKEMILLKSDLIGAIGHMEGCGHPYGYLTRKYGDKGEKLINSTEE